MWLIYCSFLSYGPILQTSRNKSLSITSQGFVAILVLKLPPFLFIFLKKWLVKIKLSYKTVVWCTYGHFCMFPYLIKNFKLANINSMNPHIVLYGFSEIMCFWVCDRFCLDPKKAEQITLKIYILQAKASV